MEGTEAADLMIREGIQLTEASIRLMAAGSKNLAAFLFALARDHKKLMGKTSMANLLREGKELKVFRIRAEDMDEFRRYAKQYGVLFAGVRDTKLDDGTIDLITNIDYVSQVNRMMERMGYVAPSRDAATTKKAVPRAPQENFSNERGNTSTNRLQTQMDTTTEKPSVKGRLAALKAASESMREAGKQHTPRTMPPR